MKSLFSNIKARIDWVLLSSVVLISLAGIVTMSTFVSESKFSIRQSIWLGISLIVFFIASNVDWRFLRNSRANIIVYTASVSLLLLLFVTGSIFKGARSWFDLGSFSFQPVDFTKLALVLLLSKYFSRRHVEIANVRHILVSGFYTFVVFALVLIQPDFGSAIIIFLIWLGMVLVSGISKKHLFIVFLVGAASFVILWSFVFKPYQKDRILTFIHPFADIRGAGYNAYQSTIAVGSGQILGKGIGQGTQSKLHFLPEFQTDFIFAAFAEEWGFVGVNLLLILYVVVIWRILSISYRGETNFEILFGFGLALIFLSHLLIHIGMNIGLLPVTGTIVPFMSYGGSHLVMEFLGLGILTGMSNYSRVTHREKEKNELIGVHGLSL